MQLPLRQHLGQAFKCPTAARPSCQPAVVCRKGARVAAQASAVTEREATSGTTDFAAGKAPSTNGSVSSSANANGPAYGGGHSVNGSQEGPIVLNGQILHNISKERLDVIHSMDDVLEKSILPILKDTSKIWQPQDFLPEPSSDTFIDEVAELRKRTDCLPDSYFVVLVGDMITEEALPTYMAMLNTLDGVRDETGAAMTPWGRWTRQWTSEENRHGDLMNKYIYLSGRVNMRAVEVTIQNLITSGMDPKTANNPYLGFIYTSFQERATKVSHGNTASHATQYGDKALGKICAAIAGDEARHEKAYIKIVDEFFRRDPNGTMIAFDDMMRKQIVMPAHYMNDSQHPQDRNLFKDFSSVAQATGTYTGQDYVNIMKFLIKHWEIETRQGLSSEAQAAQESVCKLAERFQKLTDRQYRMAAKRRNEDVPFSWLFNKNVPVRPL